MEYNRVRGLPMKINAKTWSFLTRIVPFLLSMTGAYAAQAAEVRNVLLEGYSLSPVPLQTLIGEVTPGSIVILGENHANPVHRDQHMAVLQALRQAGHKVSVGMEFLKYTDQAWVNQYVGGRINDEQFLKTIAWSGFDFQYYKQQILFPNPEKGEQTVALNIPSFVTSKIGKTGIESLTPEERALMPPDFQVGRDSYKKRFESIIHIPPGPALERYFTAQSAWDDTMAYQATQFLMKHADHVLVIVVGEFHAQYGGGLADRITARNPSVSILTLSQVWAVNYQDDGTEVPMTAEEIHNEVKPSGLEGPRGDFIWVSQPK